MSGRRFETILYEAAGGTATITLDRPLRMNAFTRQMMEELVAAFDLTDADDAVRVVIVTGSGERAFCAGADLDLSHPPLDGAAEFSAEPYRESGGRLTLRIFESLKPVIAAVNGAAVGIGVTMQLAMDIRIASTQARFGFVFPRRGVTPEAASSWFLPRLVGMQTALEWCFTGRVFGADEALARGLVRSTHAPSDLMIVARALAREIADGTAPVSVAMSRRLLWQGLCFDHPMEAHLLESRSLASRRMSHDGREGVAAFLQKRPAQFIDRIPEELPLVFPEWIDPQKAGRE